MACQMQPSLPIISVTGSPNATPSPLQRILNTPKLGVAVKDSEIGYPDLFQKRFGLLTSTLPMLIARTLNSHLQVQIEVRRGPASPRGRARHHVAQRKLTSNA